MKTYIVLFLLSAAASLVLTPVMIRVCRRFGWVDRPGDRKLHLQPVPRMGGVAVVAAFLGTLVAMFLYDNAITRVFLEIAPKVVRILGPALIVAVLGVADDLRGIRARTKFLVQILAACLLVGLGFRIEAVHLPLLGLVHLGVAGALLVTVFWVVAVTNAFNFIDGMDGLASGIALFVSLSVLAMAAVTGATEVLVLAVPLAGALAGFLPFNWHPARIFLGDGGSYFLGFVLSALAIMSSTKASTLLSVAVPIALLGIPLLDTTLAVARRFLRGQPLFESDGEHIHHRLLRFGLRQRVAVLLLYSLTVVLAGLALLGMLAGPQRMALVIPLGIGLLAVLVVRRLGYEEFDELWAMVRKAARFQRQVIANQVRLRRFVQDIHTAPDAAALFRRLEEFLAETGFSACTVELWPSPAAASPQSHKEHKDPSGVFLEPANLRTCEPSNPVPSTINYQPSTLDKEPANPQTCEPANLEPSTLSSKNTVLKWNWGAVLSSHDSDKSWQIRIPMVDSDKAHRGFIYLVRRLEQEKVLFQIASLLDTFSRHFPNCLFSFESELADIIVPYNHK